MYIFIERHPDEDIERHQQHFSKPYGALRYLPLNVIGIPKINYFHNLESSRVNVERTGLKISFITNNSVVNST